MRFAIVGGLALAALAMASCSSRRPVSPPASALPPAVAGTAARAAASPADYVASMGSIDLFVVRASAIALARSSNPRIRVLATRLAEEHRGLAAQLSMAGRRLDALPAARLLEREQHDLALLEREPRFDSAFLRIVGFAHTRSWEAHARFAMGGSSATLRPVAANGERVERSHLTLLGLLPS